MFINGEMSHFLDETEDVVNIARTMGQMSRNQQQIGLTSDLTEDFTGKRMNLVSVS